MRPLSIFAAITALALSGLVGCARPLTQPPAPPPPATLPAASAADPTSGGDDWRAVVARQEEENALLRQTVAEQNEQVDVLHREVQRLQSHAAELDATVTRLGAATNAAAAAPQPPAAAAAAPPGVDSAAGLVAAEGAAQQARQQLASAQQQLEEERRRRSNVETELSRLKEETSSAPLAAPVPAVQPGDDAALREARTEMDQLRTRFNAERSERERLAAELAALQAQPPPAPAPAAIADAAPAAEAPAPDPELEKRLAELQARQVEIIASATRDLDASRERESGLQTQLGAAQEELTVLRARAAQVTVPVAALDEAKAENQDLRHRVDDAQRHNEELSAKLKTAQRVADLIFKMRAGQVQQVLPPPRR